ncbi:MAG: hypothetical protein J7K53_08080 [Bacteroidales bacterium]|nr:hypothetical protein [Bacteroidales bacterium]
MLNFDWLKGVSQDTAKIIFLLLFIVIGIVVLFIPNNYIFQGIKKEDRHWWNNLKWWAITVLTILFYIYYIF